MAVASFVVVGIAQFTDDETLIVRLAMVLLLLVGFAMSWSWRSLRDKEVFRGRAEITPWVVGNIVIDAMVIFNLFAGCSAACFGSRGIRISRESQT